LNGASLLFASLKFMTAENWGAVLRIEAARMRDLPLDERVRAGRITRSSPQPTCKTFLPNGTALVPRASGAKAGTEIKIRPPLAEFPI